MQFDFNKLVPIININVQRGMYVAPEFPNCEIYFQKKVELWNLIIIQILPTKQQ